MDITEVPIVILPLRIEQDLREAIKETTDMLRAFVAEIRAWDEEYRQAGYPLGKTIRGRKKWMKGKGIYFKGILG